MAERHYGGLKPAFIVNAYAALKRRSSTFAIGVSAVEAECADETDTPTIQLRRFVYNPSTRSQETLRDEEP